MLAPEINWYFDGTVQEQVKDDDTGVTAVRRGLGAADLRQNCGGIRRKHPEGKTACWSCRNRDAESRLRFKQREEQQ
jgi:hypothetical protein